MRKSDYRRDGAARHPGPRGPAHGQQSESDIQGIAVHLAARIMDEAAAGQVVVSRTVKDLVAGSDIEFDDTGEHSLKGIEQKWQLFRVRQVA